MADMAMVAPAKMASPSVRKIQEMAILGDE